MPTAIVLRLAPVDWATLPASHGALAHAAALDLFLRLDPQLAHALHQAARHKPFTVSALAGPERLDPATAAVTPGQTYDWRLTGLDDAVSALLVRVGESAGSVSGVRFGGAVFRVEAVAASAADHADAGSAGYGQLLAACRQEMPPARITLHFVSPTTFRTGALDLPVPLPALVFRSLAAQWNAHAPQPLNGLDEGLLERYVAVGNWRGETRRVEAGTRRTVGCIGRFTYHVVAPPPLGHELRRALGLLATYAFYSGVGWQTTQGLGQTRAELGAG